MRTFVSIISALLLAPAVSSCASTCDDACSHIASTCADAFRAAGLTLDQGACVDDCESAYEECDAQSEALDCFSSIKSCGEVVECPTCEGPVPIAIAAPACTVACLNVANVCDYEFKTAGAAFDAALCASDCAANPMQCTNLAQRASCNASARSCGEATECPECIR